MTTMAKPKPRNQMNKRERYRTHADEVNYALNLIKNRIDSLSEKMNPLDGTGVPKLYIVLTTPELERKVFAAHANHWLKPVRVVAGRSSTQDNVPLESRRVTIISDIIGDWIYVRSEIEDILEWFTILVDVKTYVELPKGKHGLYCRLKLPIESTLLLTIQKVIEKYGKVGVE